MIDNLDFDTILNIKGYDKEVHIEEKIINTFLSKLRLNLNKGNL